MKKIILLSSLALALMPLAGMAQEVKVDQGQISISSRGRDVRQVLHDLFLQSGKNYVLDRSVTGELYLALTGVDFDEAMAIIAKTSNLAFDVRNDIYYISPNRSKVTPAPHDSKTETASGVGRLDLKVLKKTVNTNLLRTDLRKVVAELSRVSGVKIEVASEVPKYAVDLVLKKSSLGYGLKALSDAINLEVVFTDRKSILLKPKKA